MLTLSPALAAALLLGFVPDEPIAAQDATIDASEPAARAPLVAPRPARRVVTEEQIAAAIEDLAADDWATREAASRLLENAPAAVPALRDAAHDDDVERRTRAVAALSEGLRLSVRRRDTSAAVEFMQGLLALRNGVEVEGEDGAEPAPADAANLAKVSLDLFPTTLTTVAIAEIRRHGAAVARTDLFNPRFGPAFGGRVQPQWSIALDDRWTGGEAGLRHLRSIANLSQVHLTDDCPIPENARADLLAKKYGNFEVERRGKAFLGVSFGTAGAGGCRVDRVTAGGPAALAGLQPGDVIVQFGETPINTPTALLDAIREEGVVGEASDVTLLRFGEKDAIVVPVTLARWPDRPLTDPEPAPRFPFRPQPMPNFMPPRPPAADDEAPTPAPPQAEPMEEGDDLPSVPPFGPDVPAERIPGNGDPADLGDTED
ncbi:PDZ domain-containing protein [Alienimonas chondri]|uniref:PDZ domain-containing protein n=1 Tax=Alienimonas chondri TaxID=2681879 RepID=A0ABX1VGI0_9PLAN|nr:PDZ domain-containing protein [Alienimonas chondri]NNJ27234.1 hypothetical protein [Alienimonas chondri]